jgi:hypothetical protein
MNLQARLDALKERHAALELRITDEDQRPRPDGETLNRLKLEKLHVKEEIERLRAQGAESRGAETRGAETRGAETRGAETGEA